MKIDIFHSRTRKPIISGEYDSFKSAIEQNLILDSAILTGADLNGADLRNADLRNADLRNATLRNAILDGADLSGAILRNADLRDAELINAILDGADLSGATLTGADLSGATLRNADLRDAELINAILDGADLSGADLSGATLINAILDGADLRNAIGLVKIMGVEQGNIYWKRFDHGLNNNNYQFFVGLNELRVGEIFAADERLMCSYPGFHFGSRSWCNLYYSKRPLEAKIRIPLDAKINEPWVTDGKASADKIEILHVFDTVTGDDVTDKFRRQGSES
jgi:hypothetical protein